jgi:hypothetical protein
MDDATLQFYRANARSYADWAKAPSARLVGREALRPEVVGAELGNSRGFSMFQGRYASLNVMGWVIPVNLSHRLADWCTFTQSGPAVR